jgi:signal transduction histidine kinase
MEAMVTEILEAARLRQSAASLNFQRVESGAFIRSVATEFEGRPPGIELTTIEEEIVTLDPQKARTVLKNVIDNAVKYSPESRKAVTIGAKREEGCYCITVQDFGIGIPADDLERVFEPFFRVDPSRSRETGGFGLGLSLCKAIMDAHGGDIRIDSEPGRGTRVVITFPREATT